MAHQWVVQERDEDGPWHDAYVGTSSYRAITTYHELEQPKRLLRDGRVLPVRTLAEQPGLFASDNQEEA
jgi:hypothetical protein